MTREAHPLQRVGFFVPVTSPSISWGAEPFAPSRSAALRKAHFTIAARRCISSGDTSSMCVAMCHTFPNGSLTDALRSP